MDEIGGRIRRRRKMIGLTQEQLAKKSEMSTMSIRRYESGERAPDYETLSKICEALGVSIHEIAPEMILGFFNDIKLYQLLDTLGYSFYGDYPHEGCHDWLCIDRTAKKGYHISCGAYERFTDSCFSYLKFQLNELLSTSKEVSSDEVMDMLSEDLSNQPDMDE